MNPRSRSPTEPGAYLDLWRYLSDDLLQREGEREFIYDEALSVHYSVNGV
jgi:hypothetical protein